MTIKVNNAPFPFGKYQEIGANTYWEDLRIEPVVRAPVGAGVPAFEKWYDDAAGTSNGVFLYSFTDESVKGNEKEMHFSMQMPHAARLTAPISMHIHWVGASTGSGQCPVWGLEYAFKDIGSVYGDTTIVYTSTTLMPADTDIIAGKHYISEFVDITPGSSADGLSAILLGRLFRHSSTAADNYATKCGLLYIDAHYEVDSLGSVEEYKKT